jgi:membrane fusion protein, adhesin transport system
MTMDELIPHDQTIMDRIKPSVAANILLVAIVGFVLLFALWAAFAELDQVTRGTGRVIPSKQLQVVQNLEGGIVRDIAVSVGQSVKQGDVLLRMDSTQLGADFAKGQAGYNALVAKITRLQAESSFGAPRFPSALAQAAPDIVSAELTLFSARQSELGANLSVAQSHLQQAQVQAQAAAQGAHMAAQEVTMIAPLVEKGIEPRIELIRAQGRAQETASQTQAANSAVRQATSEVQAVRERHRSRAVEELAAAKAELSGQGRALPALQDRVTRTDVKAPISGTVNRVLIATVGGVVRPGEPLVEIVPKDDSLVVEAQIKPSDVAFLSPGQKAMVKITAFNYSTYGGLEGVLEYISPDAVKEDRTGETHYLVRVRTKSSVLQTKQGPRPITAGMVAEVDVMNGKRSVLDYILSPVKNVSNRALQE